MRRARVRAYLSQASMDLVGHRWQVQLRVEEPRLLPPKARHRPLTGRAREPEKTMAHANESTDSADEIPPLAFDSEEELRAVLDRLRGDLEGRVEQQAAGKVVDKGKGKGKALPESEHDRKLASDLVLKVSQLSGSGEAF